MNWKLALQPLTSDARLGMYIHPGLFWEALSEAYHEAKDLMQERKSKAEEATLESVLNDPLADLTEAQVSHLFPKGVAFEMPILHTEEEYAEYYVATHMNSLSFMRPMQWLPSSCPTNGFRYTFFLPGGSFTGRSSYFNAQVLCGCQPHAPGVGIGDFGLFVRAW